MTYPFSNLIDHKQLADKLLDWMEVTFDAFSSIKTDYAAALSALAEQLGADTVQKEAQAIEAQMISNLLFCGWLGFSANLAHFRNPAVPCFMDVDFEDFLQEYLAHSQPDYEDAQDARNRFYALLTGEQQTKYEAIITYACYLETFVPKLSHYFGYLLGNELLPRLVPGYQPDLTQTLRYNQMLEHYLGQNCLPTATGYKLQDHM